MAALLLLLAAPSPACTWVLMADGFDPALDGAVGVPVDAELVIEINAVAPVRVELAPTAGGSLVAGQVHGFPSYDWEQRVVFVPDQPLAPSTDWTASLYVDGFPGTFDPAVPVDVVGFTTGPDPDSAPVAPIPIAATHGDWLPDGSNAWYCLIGNPVDSRPITLDVDLPAAGPGDWVVVRGAPGEPGEGVVQFLEPVVASGAQAMAFPQARHAQDTEQTDCFVVALRNGAGVEAESAPICATPAATGTGTGTATGGTATGGTATGGTATGGTATGGTSTGGSGTGPNPPPDDPGCGCDGSGPGGWALVPLLALLGRVRRSVRNP